MATKNKVPHITLTFAEVDEIQPLDSSQSSNDLANLNSTDDDVFHTFQSSLQRRRPTQSFVVSRLPSHRAALFTPMEGGSLQEAVERLSTRDRRQSRKSVSRAHTISGESHRPSISTPPSPTVFCTLPSARKSVLARDILMDIAEEMCARDEVDCAPSPAADSSSARLLQKEAETKKAHGEEAHQHQRSLRFRERLKSAAAPFAEKKAVW